METSSCGEVTITMPSSGSDWKTVNATSPVPGGISTYITSISSHTTLFQNCSMTPESTGPLHTTGSVVSSSNEFTDIVRIPVLESTGRIISSVPCAFSFSPKACGIDGPVMSASRTATLYPSLCVATASMDVTDDLPTPPFPDTTPMTFFTFDCSFIFLTSFYFHLFFDSFIFLSCAPFKAARCVKTADTP